MAGAEYQTGAVQSHGIERLRAAVERDFARARTAGVALIGSSARRGQQSGDKNFRNLPKFCKIREP